MDPTAYINTKARKLTSDSEICSPDHDESGSFDDFHSELCLVKFLSEISDDLCEKITIYNTWNNERKKYK